VFGSGDRRVSFEWFELRSLWPGWKVVAVVLVWLCIKYGDKVYRAYRKGVGR